MSNSLSRYLISFPWWFHRINKLVLQTWKCQQKDMGYNTSVAFFPNRRIIFSPVCISLVTTAKLCLNHTYYRCIRALACVAEREGFTKQLFVQHMSVFCSLWLVLPWVTALLVALVEEEVGITHVSKDKHIFNSFATPGLKSLTNKVPLWNLTQLRQRLAIGSHKCATVLQAMDLW